MKENRIEYYYPHDCDIPFYFKKFDYRVIFKDTQHIKSVYCLSHDIFTQLLDGWNNKFKNTSWHYEEV